MGTEQGKEEKLRCFHDVSCYGSILSGYLTIFISLSDTVCSQAKIVLGCAMH